MMVNWTPLTLFLLRPEMPGIIQKLLGGYTGEVGGRMRAGNRGNFATSTLL